MSKCRVCGKTLRAGEVVVPVMAVSESTRYSPQPESQPTGYIHLSHFAHCAKE